MWRPEDGAEDLEGTGRGCGCWGAGQLSASRVAGGRVGKQRQGSWEEAIYSRRRSDVIGACWPSPVLRSPRDVCDGPTASDRPCSTVLQAAGATPEHPLHHECEHPLTLCGVVPTLDIAPSSHSMSSIPCVVKLKKPSFTQRERRLRESDQQVLTTVVAPTSPLP